MATKFITVSIEIMHDNNLNQSQKFILAEIEQLSQLDNGCIASNNHFAKLIGITKENVSRNINDLAKKGYISIEIVNGTRNHKRVISLTTLVTPPYQSSNPPLLKQQETKDNKTSNKYIYKGKGGKEFVSFINAMLEAFSENRILTYRDKITKEDKTIDAFNMLDKNNLQVVVDSYVQHVKDNLKYAKRLNVFLVAYSEGRIDEISNKDNNQTNSYIDSIQEVA